MKTDAAPTAAMNNIYLPDYIGKGYGTFWRFKGRFRVVKGSRASKKSKTTALWFITNMMDERYSEANTLVIRKTFRTLKDSCFAELKWAIRRLGVQAHWKITESPLEMTYLPTGQKIYFRGLDDPLKITSITVEIGVLCWMWIEEAYEIRKEEDFDIIDESIRGEVPEGLFKQITLTFNPWNEKHWMKRRFFDAPPDPDILAMTRDYTCNGWLDAADHALFERMRKENPRRFKVAGQGNWGRVDGMVYERWREAVGVELNMLSDEFRKLHPKAELAIGLDFGYTNDPSALWVGFIDKQTRQIFVWDEMYERGLQNAQIAAKIKAMGYGKDRIVADSEDPKSIDNLRDAYGLRVSGAKKGKGSVIGGIQWIQDYEIVVHPRCVNFQTEIENHGWKKDKFGKLVNEPEDDGFHHLLDAMRYALEKHTLTTEAASTVSKEELGL